MTFYELSPLVRYPLMIIGGFVLLVAPFAVAAGLVRFGLPLFWRFGDEGEVRRLMLAIVAVEFVVAVAANAVRRRGA